MNIPTLPSPTSILVGLVLIGVAFQGGAYVGKEYESGQNAKVKVEAMTDTIDKIGKLVESDKTLAMEQAAKEATAKERARSARSKGVNDAMVKANVVCDRDAVSLGLLNDAIDAANAGQGSAAGVRSQVLPAAETGGRLGQSDPGVGIRRN